MANKSLWLVPSLFALCWQGGVAVAQELPSNDALRSAIAVEELEHDAKASQARYEAVARDEKVDDAIRRHAWLRLGKLARARGDASAAAEALAMASRGDDVVAKKAAEIAKQDPQDPERARQLAEAAERAVAQLVGSPPNVPAQLVMDVIWFGDAAVPALIRSYLTAPESDSINNPRAVTSSALWSIGTKSALEFINQQLKSEDVAARRAIVSGLRSAYPGAGGTDAIRTALHDADDGVVLSAIARRGWVETADLCELLRIARPTLRLAALRSLASALAEGIGVSGADAPSKAGISREVAAVLESSLRSTDPEEFRVAAQCLVSTGGFSTEGRTLLVRWLPRWPFVSVPAFPVNGEFDGEAENAEALASAVASLSLTQKQAAAQIASNLIRFYLQQKAWGHAAMPSVLKMAALGFDYLQEVGWLELNAQPNDAARVVSALADTPALGSAAPWLARQALAPEQYEPIRRTLEMLLATDDDARRWQPPALLIALAKTGHPDALGWLRSARERGSPRMKPTDLAAAAMWAAQRRPSDESRGFLRELMASDAVSENLRSALFGQLVRMGDPAIWDAYASMREVLNRELIPLSAWMPDAEGFEPNSVAFLDWLPLRYRHAGKAQWWHGYDDATLTAIWTRLLQPTNGKYDPIWSRCGMPIYSAHEDATVTPNSLYVAFCDAAAQRCAVDDRFTMSDGALLPLLWAADQSDHADERRRTALRNLRAAAFAAKSAQIRVSAVVQVDQRRDDETKRTLFQLVGDPERDVAMRAWEKLSAIGVPIDRARIERGLSSSDAEMRRFALAAADGLEVSVADLVTPLLRDPDPGMRILACGHFAARVDLDSVPALLETLKDGEDAVRRAAAESLQSIRLYHEEKARWARVLGGKPELGKTAAAEALVDQASAKNDVDTRVLAIRSLGVLAAPETLPLLIGWTKDAEPQIAAAAREAVQRIHAAAK